MRICNPCLSITTRKEGRIAVILFLLILLFSTPAFNQDDLSIIKGKWLYYQDAPNSLYAHLVRQATDLLKTRAESVAAIHSKKEWLDRQLFISNELNNILGAFPPKTPLNAKVVRVIDKDSYRIEHIIFESQPGFYVTSSLFIPSGIRKGNRAPAILYCSGHSAEGYRSNVYLHVILNLVKKGFIVFAFDPVGQGERLEYFDSQSGKSLAGGPTSEHSYPGAQAFIAGNSQAYFMIWDGIRAVDYLLSRKEADPSRIGITGRSGGGTQSAFVAAFDDRIYAAAPENYITNYTRLLESIGPQDAEQNLFNFISRGLDHADFLTVRAPKPALMITTSGDMFSIQGALETEREVSRIYSEYGKSENFSRVEDDAPHASTRKNREAMYAFFQKHLANPGDSTDYEIPLPGSDEMRVTSTGQLSTSLKSKTVFILNKEKSEKECLKFDNYWDKQDGFLITVVESAKRLSGYIQPFSVEDPVFTGRIIRDGYVVEKYFVKGEGNYVIPFLKFIPDHPGDKYMLYLHPEGKSKEAQTGGEIERIVKNGFIVVAPDLPGTGELHSDSFKGDAYFDGVSHNIWYASMLIGRSITGIQAGDLERLVLLIGGENKNAVVSGFAKGEMCCVLLHAAAFNRKFSSVILAEPYCSFNSIVMNRFYDHKYIPTTVPGALKEYDLPLLAASLTPARLVIAGMKDGHGIQEDINGIQKATETIRNAYEKNNMLQKLLIIKDYPDHMIYD